MQDLRNDSIILVELDAILDTRLATLAKINPEAAVKTANDLRYYDRLIDDFVEVCGVTKEEFREAYKNRDVEVLQNSVMTEIILILNELTLKLEMEANDTPFVSNVIVELNVFPYQLDEDDRLAIAEAVMMRCGHSTEVKCVFYHPKEMTPQAIKNRYSGMFIYNFRDWMEHHVEAFKSFSMPRVTVMAPALFYDEIPSDDEFVKDGMRPEINAFQLSEVGAVELFALSLLPARHWCMARVKGHYEGDMGHVAPEPVREPLAPGTFTVK